MSMAQALSRIKKCKQTNAHMLYLNSLWLKELPIEILELSNLVRIDLSNNQISIIPSELGKLSNLQHLQLDNNQISDLPDSIGELRNLVSLYIRSNKLRTLPNTIGELSNLKYLHLYDNYLTFIPDTIGKLSNLQTLSIWNNNLKEVTETIGQLRQLKRLTLSHNQISILPFSITNLTNLEELNLENNPLAILPELLAKPKNPLAILDFIREFYRDEKVHLNEVKMLILGDAGVGKTSLVRRLISNQFDPTRKPTSGIAVKDLTLFLNERELTIHAWDFAGQEITHNTHQLFLTIRSVYLLVLDATLNEEGNRLIEWLDTIQLYAPDAPIVIAINKSDLAPKAALTLNTKELQSQYPIVEFINTSCQSGSGIEELRSGLIDAIRKLPHLNEALPARWMAVRNEIDNQDRDYMDYREFETLCNMQNALEASRSIAEVLHYMGILLTYGNRERRDLPLTHILNPNWVTGGIYPILTDTELTQRGKGFVTALDVERILDPTRYPRDRHGFIFDMMLEYKLAFELGGGRYLVPDLLPKEEPDFDWNSKDALHFVYQYEFLPPGLFSRFVVNQQREVVPGLVWRTGVYLHLQGKPYARVTAHKDRRTIEIAIRLPDQDGQLPTRDPRRTLLDFIRNIFDDLHRTLPGLKVEEGVPVDRVEKPIPYADLLYYESEGMTEMLVRPIGRVNVQHLLDGIATPESRHRRAEEHQPERERWDISTLKIISCFANPKELEELRYLKNEERVLRRLLSRRRGVDFEAVTATTWDDLKDILDGKQPTIFHYSGHADENGLLLETEAGHDPERVSWRKIATSLSPNKQLQCILLNGCKTSQPAFVQEFGNRNLVVIGMSAPISDQKAAIFAKRFYESYIAYHDFKTAFETAKAELLDLGDDDAATIPHLLRG